MVFTLQRYIFRELFKIFILATVALTLILSFGGILRFVQEYGVGIREFLHILFYFMPVTLTFVLPMAALFAAALTYGRFASDNELDACRASGIGIWTLVYPGLSLAILVAIANLLLSFHVMPYFVRLAEQSLTADAKQILFRNIQRQGYYNLPLKKDQQYLIYADYADSKTNTLYGIVVIESTPQGFRRIITCESARVSFNRDDRFNEVQLTTHNTKRLGGLDDMWFEIGTASFRQEFGSLLADRIKFKKIEEMKRIRANPMLFGPVAEIAHEAYIRLAAELLAQDIRTRLNSSPAQFYPLDGKSQKVRFSAKDCSLENDPAVSLQPPTVVEEYAAQGDRPPQKFRCNKAVLYLEDSSPSMASTSFTEPRLHMQLSNAEIIATGQSLIHHAISGLAMPENIAQALASKPPLQLVRPGSIPSVLTVPPSPKLAGLQSSLDRELRGTLVDITGEVNSRLVFGIGCIPMILIGIGLGIIKRGGHLLSAFGASCVPGAVLIVAIISGRQVAGNVRWEPTPGILIMWSGLVFLLLLTAVIYGKLLRR